MNIYTKNNHIDAYGKRPESWTNSIIGGTLVFIIIGLVVFIATLARGGGK